MSIEAMKLALEALEYASAETKPEGLSGCDCLICTAIPALRQAIEQAEQREDAYLFYAPGDVLICKESYERVVVKHGNTGPIQLTNGKIALEWSDEVYGEYTLEQVMDGFIREGYAPRIKQAEQAEQAEQAQPVALPAGFLDHGGIAYWYNPTNTPPKDGTELYLAPPPRKPLRDEQIMANAVLRYHFALNGGEGPLSKQGRKIIDAIEAEHGIKGEA